VRDQLGNIAGLVIGFEVLTPVVLKSAVFWDIEPCSPLKVNRRFGGIGHCLLPAYSSTLRMEAIYSSETSVNFSAGYTSLYLSR
jgi:hypothetical protein